MARTLEPALAGERHNRILTLITLIILLSGGVFLAQRAVYPVEAPLPPETIAALEKISKRQNLAGKETRLPDFMCASSLDLSIVSFLVTAAQLEEAKSRKWSLPQQSAAEKISASFAHSSFDHLRAQDAVIYLDKDSIPFLEEIRTTTCSQGASGDTCSSDKENSNHKGDEEAVIPRRLSPHQVSTLGWHLYSQLPPPNSAPGNLRAFVLVTPPSVRPFEIETEGETTSSKYSKVSYRIDDGILLVMAPSTASKDFEEENDSDVSNLAAQEIIDWLSLYSTTTNLPQQCLQKAAAEVSKFFKVLNLAPEIGLRMTADVARAADTAVETFNLAEVLDISSENEAKLKQSRSAWEAARALATHIDLGTTPQLPSEHVLALLLPIGLPIFLAIVQAVGREVKGAQKLLVKGKKEPSKNN